MTENIEKKLTRNEGGSVTSDVSITQQQVDSHTACRKLVPNRVQTRSRSKGLNVSEEAAKAARVEQLDSLSVCNVMKQISEESGNNNYNTRKRKAMQSRRTSETKEQKLNRSCQSDLPTVGLDESSVGQESRKCSEKTNLCDTEVLSSSCKELSHEEISIPATIEAKEISSLILSPQNRLSTNGGLSSEEKNDLNLSPTTQILVSTVDTAISEEMPVKAIATQTVDSESTESAAIDVSKRVERVSNTPITAENTLCSLLISKTHVNPVQVPHTLKTVTNAVSLIPGSNDCTSRDVSINMKAKSSEDVIDTTNILQNSCSGGCSVVGINHNEVNTVNVPIHGKTLSQSVMDVHSLNSSIPLLKDCVVSPDGLQPVSVVMIGGELEMEIPAEQTTTFTQKHNSSSSKAENHVAVKSHYSKEQIDQEVQDNEVFGLVSALVKFCPDLTENDYTEVSKVTGITVIMLDKKRVVVHGSWPAINRAYAMIETLQKERKKSAESVIESVQKNGANQSDVQEMECQDNKTTETEAGVAADDICTEGTSESAGVGMSDNVKTWPCTRCNKIFLTVKALQTHSCSSHGQHSCHICGKHFMKRRYLQTHMKRHANLRKFSCEVCGWKFLERYKLKLHMETHKSANERKLPYKCDICEKQFYNKAGWADHLNTHTGNRPYECETCNATFSHRIGLKRHQTTHTAHRPFKCKYCDKGFPFKAKLEAHMTVHTGMGRHGCPVCEKIFTVASSLKRHVENCRPFCCSKCGETFLRQNTMTRHLQICSGVKRQDDVSVIQEDIEMLLKNSELEENNTVFMCGVCGVTFDSLDKAQIHTSTHDETEQEIVLAVQGKDEQSVELNSVTEHIVLLETGADTQDVKEVVQNHDT